MLLATIQQQYELIYQLPQYRAIEEFMVNRETLMWLKKGQLTLRTAEQERGMLLLCPGEDELGVGIYLNERVMDNLALHDPRSGVNASNIHDFCIMVEEVSHFLYTTWRARNNRQMTRLEIELQAEVDKFIFCTFYRPREQSTNGGPSLKEILFERFSLQSNLPREAQRRYLNASRLALHYCHFLDKRYIQKNRTGQMLAEIRQFHRFGQADKISHINRSALLH